MRRRITVFAIGVVVLLALAALVSVATGPDIHGYKVPSAAMAPAVPLDAHITVNLDAYDDARPQVGDIVVFHPPVGADAAQCGVAVQDGELCPRPVPRTDTRTTFIKRVVARGGDRVQVRRGHVIRNGAPAREPFAHGCDVGSGCTYDRAITVPPGHVFLLGDSRGRSDDSRFWGPVQERAIVGRVDRCGALGLHCTPLR